MAIGQHIIKDKQSNLKSREGCCDNRRNANRKDVLEVMEREERVWVVGRGIQTGP